MLRTDSAPKPVETHNALPIIHPLSPSPEIGAEKLLDTAFFEFGGTLAGFILAIAVIRGLLNGVYLARPFADPPREWRRSNRGGTGKTNDATAAGPAATVSEQTQTPGKLAQSQLDYASREGQKNDEALQKIRKTYLANSNLAFGMLLPTLSAVYCAGLINPLNQAFVFASSLFATMALVTISIDRYHKYQSERNRLLKNRSRLEALIFNPIQESSAKDVRK
jgi:hypothetical protein